MVDIQNSKVHFLVNENEHREGSFGNMAFRIKTPLNFCFLIQKTTQLLVVSLPTDFFKMDIEQENPQFIIGYYPFRGKAQICRLLCEYLHIPYQDKFFTPDQWNHYRQSNNHKWVIKDLPFLQHGDFIVTGATAIIQYILEYAGRTDLLGKTIDDKLTIDSIRNRCDLTETILGITCATRPTCPTQLKKCTKFYWSHKIQPTMKKYQKQCLNHWFMDSITVMDFIVYEIINQAEKIFPQQAKQFTKLLTLRRQLGRLPQIQGYENSTRAVKEDNPVRYFRQFKLEKLKLTQLNTSASSTNSSPQQMDIE